MMFEDVWVVATTQIAKYCRFNKTSLVQYNPGWCKVGVVNVHTYAPPCTTTFLAGVSLEYSLWLSSSIYRSILTQEERIEDRSSILRVRCYWNCYLSRITYHFFRIYHRQATKWYCFLSLICRSRTWHILNEVGLFQPCEKHMWILSDSFVNLFRK